MKKYLLLHGRGGNANENWFSWLRGELESKAYEVFAPNLPNTDNPILDEQMEYISVYAGDFDDGGYIIAHSLGCQLALKFIEEYNIKNITLILVAPSYPKLDSDINKDVLGDKHDLLKKYFDTKLNFEKINKLNNEYIVFLSKNDPLINIENAKKYYKNLTNCEFVDFENKGHFDDLVLNEILDY